MTEDNELIEHIARAMADTLIDGESYVGDKSDLDAITLDGSFSFLDLARAALTAYRNHQVEL